MEQELKQEKKCYIISPIGEDGDGTRIHADLLYSKIFAEVAKEHHLAIKRADLDSSNAIPIEKICEDIRTSDIIIADLYNNNPNVMYEIGFAHTLGKLPICIKPMNSKIPFDIQSYKIVSYDNGIIESPTNNSEISLLKQKLSEIIANVKNDLSCVENHFLNKIKAEVVEEKIMEYFSKHNDMFEDIKSNIKSIVDNYIAMEKRDYIKAYYIDGENNAFNALTEAINEAKISIRSTRFSPFTVVTKQKEFFNAIQNATEGSNSRKPVDNFYRIITVNSKEKLQEVIKLLTSNVGKNFTLYLTNVEYGFEMVIIDEREVFIHFRKEDETDKLITSTLKMIQPSVAKEFAKIFDDLSKKSIIEIFECKNLTQETLRDATNKVYEIFDEFSTETKN